MESICERDPSYGDMNWDTKTIVAANGLSKMYHSFNFIVSFISASNALSIIKPISVKLQNRSYDIVKAYNKVKDVIRELHTLRGSDTILHSWYVQAESLAGKVNIVPQVPRTATRQQHRDNVEHDSVTVWPRSRELICEE